MERVAFSYSEKPHQRRHGPAGYVNYEEYRPWLEDEFSFRCVYCLKRVVWAPTDIWTIDHLIPQHLAPHLVAEYDNLVFACQFCNGQKRGITVPDPCKTAYGASLRVEVDGRVTALDANGRRLEEVIRLNHPRMVAFRLRWMKVLQSVENDPAQYKSLLGFPDDLPDLATRKPKSNSRPEGVLESCFARRQRGTLPETY
jgi:5-methylcytosine-specific restriction endonuclease McrA